MDLGLRGKVVVVTGGSSGIGFGIVREFLKENCLAAFCSRNEERLASALAQLGEEGYPKGERVMGESVDVRDDKALQAFADAVSERWGRIDVWINQAGAAHFKSLCDFTVEEFREELDLHVVSCFSGCRIAAGHMRKTGGGVILNVSSLKAFMPSGGKGPYGAGKAAVVNLTRSFAAELACHNIRVVCYAPGHIRTNQSAKTFARFGEAYYRQIPLRRPGLPEDVAGPVVFLASERASYITGVCVQINGGKCCVQNPSYSYEDGGEIALDRQAADSAGKGSA